MPMNPRLLRPRQNIGWDTVSRDIVGFWPLSNELDYSGNELHLDPSSSGNTAFSTTVFKVGGGSLMVIDPNDAYLRYIATIPAFSDQMTLTGWYKTSGGFDDEPAVIFSGNGNVYVRRFLGALYVSAGDGADAFGLQCGANSGQWLFFCLRRQGNTTSLWINDGSVRNAITFAQPSLGTSFDSLAFLGDVNQTYFSDMASNLDAVGLWRRALSDAEVLFLYNNGQGREYLNLPFSPRALSGLSAWYDAADQSKVSVSGSAVAGVTDKSGNGKNLTGTAPNQPTYTAAKYNGKNVITFSAASHTLTHNVPLGTSQTIFLVTTRHSGASGAFITNSTSGTGGPSFISKYATTQAWDFEYYTFSDRIGMAPLNTAPAGLNMLGLTNVQNGVANAYLNGAPAGVDSSSTTPVNGAALTTISSQGFLGDVAEYIIYSRVLPVLERWQIEGYLAWKWGIQSSLPIDHPYKNSPDGLFAAMGVTSSGAAISPTDYTEGGVSWRAHTFTTSGTLSFSRSGDIEYFIVAGGGGGATNCGGGGGGGGIRSGSLAVSAGSQTITVGAGGAVGGNGLPSSALGISATGGGAGGSIGNNGSAGGSGGGGGGGTTTGPRIGGAGTAGQGNAGGSSTGGSGALGGISAGGGGGASASGGNATALPAAGGTGGSGLVTSISGTSLTYGSGGGGGSDASTGFAGGSGGGTGGFFSTTAQPGQAAVSSRGGGGGGGARDGASGGVGGSGVVIVRYKI